MFSKPKKSFVLISLLLMVFLMISCSKKNDTKISETGDAANKEKLNVAVTGSMYPLNFTDNEELKGYEVDVWKEIGKRQNFDVEFTASNFASLFGMLDANKVDTIANVIAINEEREKKYEFSESYMSSEYKLVTKKGAGLKSLEDFKEKKVGVVAGGLGDIMLHKVSEENDLKIEIIGYEGTSGMDSDLDLGRLDARLGPAVQTQGVIDKNNLNFELTDVVIFKEKNAFPFSKAKLDEKKLSKVNDALKSMKEDGTLKDLSIKWFKIDVTQ